MYIEKYLNCLHTSSGWASDEEFSRAPGCLEGRWDQIPAQGGVVLANGNGRVVVDGGDECRHVLVIGATGTGKSRLIILPSLLYSLRARERRSFVVFDVKGELERATADLAAREGYKRVRIDFRDPEKGVCWNPFAKLDALYRLGKKGRELAWKRLEAIIDTIFNDGERRTADPFWRNTCAGLFRGICATIWEGGEKLSLSWILEHSNSLSVDREKDAGTLLYDKASSLPADTVAWRNLAGFYRGSGITRGNVLASFNSYVAPLASRSDILEMMSREDSVDFSRIGREPTVLYISLPDDSTALGALQSMLLTQLTQELNECAVREGGRLPVRTEIYLDELCNIHPAIPGLETALTISRSRGIRYVLAIQSYSQLAGIYGVAAETIAANCSTWIALNIAKDEIFRAKLSQLCGPNPLGEPLITPAQLSLLKYEEGIVIRERVAPYYARFEDLSRVQERLREADAREPLGPEERAAG